MAALTPSGVAEKNLPGFALFEVRVTGQSGADTVDLSSYLPLSVEPLLIHVRQTSTPGTVLATYTASTGSLALTTSANTVMVVSMLFPAAVTQDRRTLFGDLTTNGPLF